MIHSTSFGGVPAFPKPLAALKRSQKDTASPLFGHRHHVHGSQCSHSPAKKDKESSPGETKGFLQRISGWLQDGWMGIKKGLNAFAQWVQNLWGSKTLKKDSSQKDSETTTPKPQKTTHHHHGHGCGHRHSHH